MPPFVIFLVLVVPVLAFYGLVLLARRSRLRKAASALQGTYAPGSWWRQDTILGKDFTIAVERGHRSFRTRIEVRARQTPGPAVLDARFFEAYPDWEHARVLKSEKERLFVTEVSIPQYGPPTGEDRESIWRWLNRGSTDRRLPYDTLKAARIAQIFIRDGQIATSFNGVVTNVARLGDAIDLLGRLAFDDGMHGSGNTSGRTCS